MLRCCARQTYTPSINSLNVKEEPSFIPDWLVEAVIAHIFEWHHFFFKMFLHISVSIAPTYKGLKSVQHRKQCHKTKENKNT